MFDRRESIFRKFIAMKGFLPLIVLISLVLFASCKKDDTPPGGNPPPLAVKLKEINNDKLPSPYYFFEYNSANQVKAVSFQSGFLSYQASYLNNQLNILQNNTAVNKTRIEYRYTNGKVTSLALFDNNGVQKQRCFLDYSGNKLVRIDWELRQPVGYIQQRSMELSYYPDGNLKEIIHIKNAIDNVQTALQWKDTYSNYDNKPGVEGFAQIHPEDDELIFLPGVEIQKNNPGKIVRTGEALNYEIVYTYTYDEQGKPTTKKGDFLITSGPNQGTRSELHTFYTYYQ